MSVAEMRAKRRELSKRLATDSPATLLRTAHELLGSGQQFMAYELVQHHAAALTSLDAKKLEALGHAGPGLDSWAAVDCFACYLAGPVWQSRQVPDSLIHGWARSPDRWWRRAALVATVALSCPARGGRGDTARTLRVCRILAGDRDDMVVKALSWALRELSKRAPRAVRDFLTQQPELAPRVIREVRNKLTTGLKNP
jgi:3-methyladenine DNA glycosylase AlkD